MNAPLLLPAPPLRDAISRFSTKAAGGCSVQGCPMPGMGSLLPQELLPPIPQKPCNLLKLKILEPFASPLDEEGTRSAEFLPQGERVRTCCPVLLGAGRHPFQITAASKQQAQRNLGLAAMLDGWCGDPRHQRVRIAGPGLAREFEGPTGQVTLHRRPLLTDEPAPDTGLFAFINAAWQACADPAVYEVTAVTCGLPTSAEGVPVSTLLGTIEVFPADKYELVLNIPALLKPDLLKFEAENRAWDKDDRQNIAFQGQLRKGAVSYYRTEAEVFGSPYSAEVARFVAESGKRKSGEDDQDFLGKLKIEFTQEDGGHTLKAPIHDAVKLVRCIRSAEYQAKQVSEWIKEATIGPGASVAVECQFLDMNLKAAWNRAEYTDDRVFLKWQASLDVWAVKLKVEIAIGWRCAGLADLFLELSGTGKLGASGEAAHKSPDELVEFKLKPKGKLQLQGLLKGQLMWAISGETGIECEFKANFDKFRFMRDGQQGLGGEIEIEREPVYRVVTYSCRLFGGETTEKEEVLKADPHFGHFQFG